MTPHVSTLASPSSSEQMDDHLTTDVIASLSALDLNDYELKFDLRTKVQALGDDFGINKF